MIGLLQNFSRRSRRFGRPYSLLQLLNLYTLFPLNVCVTAYLSRRAAVVKAVLQLGWRHLTFCSGDLNAERVFLRKLSWDTERTVLAGFEGEVCVVVIDRVIESVETLLAPTEDTTMPDLVRRSGGRTF